MKQRIDRAIFIPLMGPTPIVKPATVTRTAHKELTAMPAPPPAPPAAPPPPAATPTRAQQATIDQLAAILGKSGQDYFGVLEAAYELLSPFAQEEDAAQAQLSDRERHIVATTPGATATTFLAARRALRPPSYSNPNARKGR